MKKKKDNSGKHHDYGYSTTTPVNVVKVQSGVATRCADNQEGTNKSGIPKSSKK